MSRELDAEVAEKVMGLEFGGPKWLTLPLYSSSIEEAMEVENQIAKLGLIREYVRALEHIGDMSTPSRVITDTGIAWRLAHATAEQRCRAALAAVTPSS